MDTEVKFYTCKNDRAFKEVFMKKENSDLLTLLLEKILKVKVNEIEYLNLEDNVDNINVRRKSYDLRLNTDKGRILVEVNASIYDYSHERQTAYLCNEYSHITLSGEDYSEDIDIIQINLTYGKMKNFSKENKYLYDDKEYRIFMIQDEENKKYVKNFKIYDINMDYYMNFWYTNDKEKIEENKYLIMLNLGQDDLEKLSKKDRKVEKYMAEIKKINIEPKFIEFISYEEDQKKREKTRLRKAEESGFEQGIEQGIEQGSLSKSKEIAESLLKQNIDINIIAECTGLSLDELKKIESK